jgi:hypothetical protein
MQGTQSLNNFLRKKFSTNNYSNNSNNKFSKEFYQWLVGFTDGDGSFSIVKSGNSYRLHFGLGQSFYNLRLLYWIKSNLGYGSVTKYNTKKVAQLRITDRKVLNNIIFPIFDQYPLLTSKYFNYMKFKEAYNILERKDLSTLEKNNLIFEVKNKNMPNDFVSPAINHLSLSSEHYEIKTSISISWLVGFIEAEGNFGLYSSLPLKPPLWGPQSGKGCEVTLFCPLKGATSGPQESRGPDKNRFNIEFTIVQKLDKLLLESIRHLLHIPSKIQYSQIRNIYSLKTKNSRAVSNIIDLFQGKFKGVKSLEFKLWSKAYYYKKINPNKVEKIHSIFLKLRNKQKQNSD